MTIKMKPETKALLEQIEQEYGDLFQQMQKIPVAERETHINWMANEKVAEIYTDDFRVARRLIKAGYEPDGRQIVGVFFTVPLNKAVCRLVRG